MKKIISVVLRKGGTGKTTTLMALADGLAIRGEKVLVIDLDSQMNLSMLYGNFHLKEKSIFNVLTEKSFNIYDAIYSIPDNYFNNIEVKGKIDIIPANSYVDQLDKSLDEMMRKEERLLRAIQKLNPDDYDYVLIDTGPINVTNVVITNVIVASDEIILPARLEELSYKGIELILPRVEMVIEEELNPELKINGILATQVIGKRKNTNKNLYNKLIEYAKKKNIYVYENYIRNLEGVVAKQYVHESIFNPKVFEKEIIHKDGTVTKRKFTAQSEIAKDYNEFINEFLEREEKYNAKI